MKYLENRIAELAEGKKITYRRMHSKSRYCDNI